VVDPRRLERYRALLKEIDEMRERERQRERARTSGRGSGRRRAPPLEDPEEE
jgi:hypothetical protein